MLGVSFVFVLDSFCAMLVVLVVSHTEYELVKVRVDQHPTRLMSPSGVKTYRKIEIDR